MPDGTIEDSRNPNSPQWGYLRVDDSSECDETLEVHAELVDPGNENGLLDEGRDGIPAWNDILLYVNNTDDPETGELVRGDRVCFKMVRKSINMEGDQVGFWVARVTKKLN